MKNTCNSSSTIQDSVFVMIRGLVRDKRHWYGFPKALQQKLALKPHHIQTIDLPQPSTWQEVKEYAKPSTCSQILTNCLPKTAPFHLIGVSLASLACLTLQNHHPKRCLSLCFINPSHPKLSPTRKRLSTHILIRLFFAHLLSRSFGEKAIIKATINHPQARKDILQDALKWQQEEPWSYKTLISQLMYAREDHTLPRASELPPTLILTSSKDRLVSNTCSKALADRLQAKQLIHPAAGHDLTTEDPHWCLEHLKAFYHSAIPK